MRQRNADISAGAAAFLLVALCACGGGGGGGTPSITVVPTPSATSSPQPTATPTTAPTSTPTTAPQALQISPASVAFSSATPVTVAVREAGYTAAFTEADTCNGASGDIAEVSTTADADGSATFSVVPRSAGTCAITVRDANGQSADVPVTVTTASIGIQ